MTERLETIRALIASGEVRISEHGYDELADDRLTVEEALAGVHEATMVETYPENPRSPSLLLLQKDREGFPIHVVWGIPRGYNSPVVLVTAYRPDPERWDENFTKRQPS